MLHLIMVLYVTEIPWDRLMVLKGNIVLDLPSLTLPSIQKQSSRMSDSAHL